MHRTRARTIVATAAAIAIAVGMASGTAGAAGAQDGTAAKRVVEGKIDLRLAQLDRLHALVDASKDVTDEDRSALDTILDNEKSGLTDLRAHVDAATDLQTIAADAQSMIEDYRVFVVVTPQVHLVLATDVGSHAIAFANNTVAPLLDSAIARAQAAGKNVDKAQADDNAFKAAVAAAASDLDGQVATLLAQVPHGFPGNHQTFLDARAKIADARAQLSNARTAAHDVIEDLKSA